MFLPHGLRAGHHGFSTNYVKFHFEFPKTHSLFVKQTITDTSYCLPECSQLPTICRQLLACLEWAGKLRGFSVLVWEMERIQFLVVKKGGVEKNTKNWGMTLRITEKNTGLVLWPLVS